MVDRGVIIGMVEGWQQGRVTKVVLVHLQLSQGYVCRHYRGSGGSGAPVMVGKVSGAVAEYDGQHESNST